MSIFDKIEKIGKKSIKSTENFWGKVDKLPSRVKRQIESLDREARTLKRQTEHQTRSIKGLTRGFASRLQGELRGLEDLARQLEQETRRIEELASVLADLTRKIDRLPGRAISTAAAYDQALRPVLMDSLSDSDLEAILDAGLSSAAGSGEALRTALAALVDRVERLERRLPAPLPIDLGLLHRQTSDLVDALPGRLVDQVAGLIPSFDLTELLSQLEALGDAPASAAVRASGAGQESASSTTASGEAAPTHGTNRATARAMPASASRSVARQVETDDGTEDERKEKQTVREEYLGALAVRSTLQGVSVLIDQTVTSVPVSVSMAWVGLVGVCEFIYGFINLVVKIALGILEVLLDTEIIAKYKAA